MLWRRKTQRTSSPVGGNPAADNPQSADGAISGVSTTMGEEANGIDQQQQQQQQQRQQPMVSKAAELETKHTIELADPDVQQHFQLIKWNACALWSWDVMHDTCVICRNGMMNLCIHCQAKIGTCPLDEVCTVAWGVCNHAYHLHCIKRWLESSTRPRCPLDNSEWEFTMN